ncbi:hypothetical protein SAMN02745962_01653 [Pseudomonas sp. LAIL14HWK12:I11]|nr:hypothetical protein SAMN02745962_01653 [Pseudomonas sp. LAIL14HWK12:I11]
MGIEYPGQGGLTPRPPHPGRSSLVLRRGPWQQRRFGVLSPASSQHEAAPTGGCVSPQVRVVTNGPAAALSLPPAPATAPTGRSSLVLRRGPWQQQRFSVLSPASSQHEAAPTGGCVSPQVRVVTNGPAAALSLPPAPATAPTGRSSLVLRRGPWQQRRFSVLSPASSQHEAAPTGGCVSPQIRVVTNGLAAALSLPPAPATARRAAVGSGQHRVAARW